MGIDEMGVDKMRVSQKKDDTPVQLQYKMEPNHLRTTFSLSWTQQKVDINVATITIIIIIVHNNTGVVSELKDLMDAFYHTVTDKWEHIGIYLHLPMTTLKVISEQHQHDPHKCLVEMLEVWVKRLHLSL